MTMLLGACLSLLLLSQTLGSVTALTNMEFLGLIEDFSTDLTIKDAGLDDADDDVIVLPGGPNEEIDLLYLAARLGFSISEVPSYQQLATYVDQEDKDSSPLLGGCSCSGLSCSCCGSHRFNFNIFGKKIDFTLSGCADLTYLTQNQGFNLKLTVNGHTLYNKEVSLRNPPALCYGIPGFRGFARVCLQFYNVDLGSKSACAKLTGVLDFKLKKFSVDLPLGCFRISMLTPEDYIRMRISKFLKEKKGLAPEVRNDWSPEDDENLSDDEDETLFF